MVILGLPENEQSPILLIFILLKYLDHIIYVKIFNYLVENYNFFPDIIHTDFENALQLAIKNNKYFGAKIIHSKCLFHFGQIIRKQL